MMKRAPAFLLAMLALAFPASATESMLCSAEGDAASIDVLMGNTAVIAPVRVWLNAGDKSWTTDGQPGSTKIVIGQAFQDESQLLLDVTDENITSVIASLRLVTTSEGNSFASGGTLRIVGVGAWAVSCPEF